jgi:hypothetical protein
VPPGRRGVYTLCGLAALVLGCVFFSWTGYSADLLGGGDYFRSVFDPSHLNASGRSADSTSLIQGLVLCVSGALAIAGRRSAKGALIAVSVLTLFDAARGLIGLHNDPFRSFYTRDTPGKLQITTWVLTIVIGLVLIVVLLAARGGGTARPAYYPPQNPGGWQQPGGYPPPAGGGYAPQDGYAQPQPPQVPPQPPAGPGYGYPQPPQGPPGR